ncbi:hypothetical protein [Kineococcus arenarius]|uniref:hypothetical protein n=1 Tax=unclassified Kineococcus TaxID=2621656 RepID=UPI003D7DC132
MSEQPEPGALVGGVSAVLRALTPTDALTWALRPMSRSPGHLAWSWAVVSEEELRAVAGFPPPRVPAWAVEGLVEVFAVPGREGEARLERDESGRLFTSSFAVFYLPESSSWRNARRSSVLSSNTMALYVREADEQEWPRQMGRRRQEFAADGSLLALPAAPDFAVVQVAGTAVGVQVDTSGAVALGWSLRRSVRGAERQWNVELHLRREPEEALRLVHGAGLLT